MTEAVSTEAPSEDWVDQVRQRLNEEDATETIKMTCKLVLGLVCEGVPTPVIGVEDSGIVSLSWLTTTTFMEVWVNANSGYDMLWMNTTVTREDRKPEDTLEFTETNVKSAINAVASWDFTGLYENRSFS